MTNPANTGFLTDADYRLGISYRRQYSNILSNPYRSFSASGDAAVFQNWFTYAWAGIGGLLISDVAGTGNLNTTKAYLSFSFHQMLGQSSLLSAGCNLGWVTKSINPSKLTFPDQFNGIFFDPNLPTGSSFIRTSLSYPDLQVGINYSYFATDEIYFKMGYQLANALKPKETFFSGSYDERINYKHTGFLNAILKTGSILMLQPSLLYSSQAGAISWTAGTQAQLLINKQKDISLLTGFFWRKNDAIIPSLGLQVKRFSLNFTYDLTNSGLSNYNKGYGASEFNLTSLHNIGEKPSREFNCPHF